jgi:tRNA modification GTPase
MTTLQSQKDTIAALATPKGRSALALIRISGPRALELACALSKKKPSQLVSHRAHFTRLYDCMGELIDEVILTPYLKKRSFTGEDLIEITPHGSELIIQKILDELSARGARPAQPGEFSLRAWKNGKVDLVQAEAIQSLISAKSLAALKIHQQQLQGGLSKKIIAIQDNLIRNAAIFEAWVDFPEEGLEFAGFDEVKQSLQSSLEEIDALIDSYAVGKKVTSGEAFALVGAPNVGKSSLLNALLQKERAIVTNVPGTTRDFIEESLWIGNAMIRLIDTAGIRKSEDPIESEGIRRSKEKIEEASFCLCALDATQPTEALSFLNSIPEENRIVVWNKIDLLSELEINALPKVYAQAVCHVSAKTSKGIGDLRETLEKLSAFTQPESEEIVLTQARHVEALRCAKDALEKTLEGLVNKVSAEFVAFDARKSLEALSRLVGRNVSDDIISAIFSQFCLGK